jgi:hypothetical protein
MDDSSRYLEETFGGFLFFFLFLAKRFVEVAPLDLVVCLGGNSKTTLVGAGRVVAPWSGQGHSAGPYVPQCGSGCFGQQGPPQPGFLTGGLSAPYLLRKWLHNRKPARVCFVLLRSLARAAGGGGGRAGAVWLPRAPGRLHFTSGPAPRSPPEIPEARTQDPPRGKGVWVCRVWEGAEDPRRGVHPLSRAAHLDPAPLATPGSSALCTSLPGLSSLTSARSHGIECRGSLPEFSRAVPAGTALQQLQLERTPFQFLRALGLQHLLNWG